MSCIDDDLPAALSGRPKGGEQAKAAAGSGLSNGHIGPLSPINIYNLHIKHRLDSIITYNPQGQLITLKTAFTNRVSNVKEHKRKSVKGFSARSRKRMMIFLSRTHADKLPLFITLTYPAEFPPALDTKRHLKAFIKRLKRRYPELGYIWKLEKQKRGAPHYHLFTWGIHRNLLLCHISEDWYNIVDSGDPKHLLAGTQVSDIIHRNGIMKYCSKYLAVELSKEDKNWQYDLEEMGRCWGKGGNIPMSDQVQFKITRDQAFRILRMLRRRTEQSNQAIRNYFVQSPDFWLKRHEDLTGDKIPF
jgi:hypothetical protein